MCKKKRKYGLDQQIAVFQSFDENFKKRMELIVNE